MQAPGADTGSTESCIINPCRAPGEPALPATGVLAVNPSDTRAMAALADRRRLRRHFLFHSRLYAGADLFLAGPAVGAPMAALCLEKLIALGARRVVLYGWCGSLARELACTDLLVPTWGLAEEGTSVHYGGPDRPRCDEPLAAALAAGLAGRGRLLRGPVWTTDAPYRETREKVARYGRQGIMAVDMEYSALCSVARFRATRLAALMLVSDELWQTPWRPRYPDRAFRARSAGILELLVDLLLSSPQDFP